MAVAYVDDGIISMAASDNDDDDDQGVRRHPPPSLITRSERVVYVGDDGLVVSLRLIILKSQLRTEVEPLREIF